MKIKGVDGSTHSVTSQGQGTLNTVLGGAALLNSMNNGCNKGSFFSNILGGGNNNGDCYVTEKEFQWAQLYNTKQSEVDMLKSDQRTDGKILDLYREIDRRFNDQGQLIANIAATQAVTNEKLNGTISLLDTKIDSTTEALNSKINTNVAAIYRDIDCRTLPLEKKVPLDSICPQAAPLHPDVQLVQIVQQAVQAALAAK